MNRAAALAVVTLFSFQALGSAAAGQPGVQCKTAGRWVDNESERYVIRRANTGSLVAPGCAARYSLVVSAVRKGAFTIDGTYESQGMDCVPSFVESLAFTDCDHASGTVKNQSGNFPVVLTAVRGHGHGVQDEAPGSGSR